MSLGGSFDKGQWESQRATLHHNDYHYRFYHYLSKSTGETEEAFAKEVAAVLAGMTKRLPESAEKAFKNWRGISKELRDLFNRAPREAVEGPEVALARMALAEIGNGGYPKTAATAVRERAERVLAECTERSGGLVEKTIEEPRRLVKKMDEFIALFSGSRDHRLAAGEAERRVREFLGNCRQLDRALSDIPRRLRESGA